MFLFQADRAESGKTRRPTTCANYCTRPFQVTCAAEPWRIRQFQYAEHCKLLQIIGRTIYRWRSIGHFVHAHYKFAREFPALYTISSEWVISIVHVCTTRGGLSGRIIGVEHGSFTSLAISVKVVQPYSRTGPSISCDAGPSCGYMCRQWYDASECMWAAHMGVGGCTRGVIQTYIAWLGPLQCIAACVVTLHYFLGFK